MEQSSQPTIDPILFEIELQLFKQHVYEKSGFDLISFNSNPYTEREEGYKYDIHRKGRTELNFESWNSGDTILNQFLTAGAWGIFSPLPQFGEHNTDFFTASRAGLQCHRSVAPLSLHYCFTQHPADTNFFAGCQKNGQIQRILPKILRCKRG